MARLVQLEIDFAAEVPVARMPHDEDLKHPSWCITRTCCYGACWAVEWSEACKSECPMSFIRSREHKWTDEERSIDNL